MMIPTLSLSNGVKMPAIGLGTYPLTGEDAVTAVQSALELGYRLIDTAENYGNEAAVGEAVRRSGLPRGEVFITSKFNRRWHSVAGVREAAAGSLERLGVEYIDLLLIHWPNPDQDRYVEAWQGLIELLDQGVVRAIGTSNFKPAHLERIIGATGVAPMVNQIQLSPWLGRTESVGYNQSHGILTEAWSPIKPASLLADPAIVAIAKELDATPAQVVLRWHTQHGYLPIPKSASPVRQAENLAIWEWTLSEEDMATLDGLNQGESAAADSDTFGH